MNNSSLVNLSVNISNGWIIGCSILTVGILTRYYLDGISDIYIWHKFRLYNKKIK